MGFQGRPQGHSQRASHKNIYDIASTILTKLDREQGTIKSLVLADNIPEKKKTYALVCESLKYRDALNELIAASDLLNLEKKVRAMQMCIVLVYDLLFGRGVRSGGHYLRIIMNHKVRLSGELTKLKIKRGVKTNRELIPEAIRKAVVLPRYVRVNTLKNSSEQVIKQFESEGYRAVPIVNLADVRTIQVDKHVPNLLVFPANTDFHEHPLLLNGGIVLQDKASCFPAYILNPPPNSTVIDACAAPGNKTSHLSAIMNNTGRIYAFDKDQKRLQTLIKLCGRAGCKNIDALNQSFLDADPTSDKYKKVEYILLDPSCSGSGIVRRLDHLLAPNSSSGDAARVQSLADFQVSVLLHAFKFPNVRKVVYSTCSRHQEENEMVVKRVLEAQPDFVLAANVFPQWHRRGDPIVDGRKSRLSIYYQRERGRHPCNHAAVCCRTDPIDWTRPSRRVGSLC
ncbi:S-adenosyl-L-methionine-dependent methyltransferase [Polychytrium aggregatum]|uniref:S-adenosyl-L-methionine-dependent methyltransferase n=1 Tax=Polychytrium aggregatum TaxID=110093 RepID=UPI0022FF3360|nr:S-adenosyl-L-methionine-dependent methyltransferase [Polychytrium aggregatum]KAI9204421.1 S-adenosyl-L-methionine-dependent methyltransferase [Polychytrium aggregatum]